MHTLKMFIIAIRFLVMIPMRGKQGQLCQQGRHVLDKFLRPLVGTELLSDVSPTSFSQTGAEIPVLQEHLDLVAPVCRIPLPDKVARFAVNDGF